VKLVNKKIKIKGMHCNSCEKIISKEALKNEHIKNIDINYITETATITFDENKISLNNVKKQIENKGYSCSDLDTPTNKKNIKNYWKNLFGWFFGAAGIILIIYFISQLYGVFNFPEISTNMGYGLLFVVGLLTGFHCVGMCGGFVVSYTAKGVKEGKKPYHLHFNYGLGKVISYTLIGAFFGLIGSIFAFTPFMRGMAGIIAGIFLIMFGLKMLNVFPSLRKFNIKLPSFVNKFTSKSQSKYSNSPLIIGLLNGLMIACGPLQAIYIMAAGTGSMIEGGILLFIFALGTLPVMLGFGYLTSIITSKSTHKILKASGVIVIILGVIMLNRGLALTGSGYDFNTLSDSVITSAYAADYNDVSNTEIEGLAQLSDDGYQEITMTVTRYGWDPDRFIIQEDVPVRWIINAEELTGCNNAISVPSLGLNFDLKEGEQVIEFTATETGTISWSCWMGMIPGVFIVEEELSNIGDINTILEETTVPEGGSCGGDGGCGCGSR
jgi:uncharacterized protein